MTRAEIRTVLNAYIACAVWTFGDDAPIDPGKAQVVASDLHPDTYQGMRRDVVDFLRQALPHLALWPQGEQVTWDQLGHDFWLTRNRHGAGFWDRGWGGLGRVLTEISHGMGRCELWLDEDGKLRDGE